MAIHHHSPGRRCYPTDSVTSRRARSPRARSTQRRSAGGRRGNSTALTPVSSARCLPTQLRISMDAALVPRGESVLPTLGQRVSLSLFFLSSRKRGPQPPTRGFASRDAGRQLQLHGTSLGGKHASRSGTSHNEVVTGGHAVTELAARGHCASGARRLRVGPPHKKRRYRGRGG